MLTFDERLHKLIKDGLQEDIGDGDHSTLSCIPHDVKGKAVLKIKQDGILAGLHVAEKIFHFQEPGCRFTAFKKDGDDMKHGETAFEVEALIHTILQCERLLLNCMQRMSGVATLTRQYVNMLYGYKTQLLDTRKTTPNIRVLEKEAVRIGGGVNHRFGLFDMIMLKDNHIDYCGSIEQAIEKAYRYVQEKKPGLIIEVEARSIDEVKTILSAGQGKVSRIMFDNFTPEQVVEAMTMVPEDFETEASGGINLDNIEEYAKTGVNYVSVGALIHQAKSLDMSLDALPAQKVPD